MLQKALRVAALILMVTALYLIFVYAGVDAQQGQPFRIFYFHVPIELMGYLSALLLGACLPFAGQGREGDGGQRRQPQGCQYAHAQQCGLHAPPGNLFTDPG